MRIISFTLSLLMLASVFAGCLEDTDDNSEPIDQDPANATLIVVNSEWSAEGTDEYPILNEIFNSAQLIDVIGFLDQNTNGEVANQEDATSYAETNGIEFPFAPLQSNEYDINSSDIEGLPYYAILFPTSCDTISSNQLYLGNLNQLIEMSEEWVLCTSGDGSETNDEEEVNLQEGDLIPETNSHAYVDNSWINYSLSESINTSGNHHIILFTNTDCSYCMVANSDIETYAEQYSVDVVYIMVGFQGASWSNTSREEIVAFRNMDNYSGCGGDTNCDSRDGNPHNWTYVDDLQDINMENWGVIGTPTAFIVDGESKLVWHPEQHRGDENSDDEDLGQGLERILG